MAELNKKITGLNSLTDISDDDLVVQTDVSDQTDDPAGTNKTSTWTVIKAFLLSYFAGIFISLVNLDTDETLAANSDSKVASQKAVKSYIDDNLALELYVNARDFGAVGDGVTDDTAAIEAAIAALPAWLSGAGGGVVFFPEGEAGIYKTTYSIRLTSAVNLMGLASTRPIIRGNFAGALFNTEDTGLVTQKLHIRLEKLNLINTDITGGVDITLSASTISVIIILKI